MRDISKILKEAERTARLSKKYLDAIEYDTDGEGFGHDILHHDLRKSAETLAWLVGLEEL